MVLAGQSSTITGVYTGQFVMSGFLDMQISQWQRIGITRSVALVPTLLVSLLYRQPGGTELDTLNEWLNVLQSMQIPFALLPVSLLKLTAYHSACLGSSLFRHPRTPTQLTATRAATCTMLTKWQDYSSPPCTYYYPHAGDSPGADCLAPRLPVGELAGMQPPLYRRFLQQLRFLLPTACGI